VASTPKFKLCIRFLTTTSILWYDEAILNQIAASIFDCHCKTSGAFCVYILTLSVLFSPSVFVSKEKKTNSRVVSLPFAAALETFVCFLEQSAFCLHSHYTHEYPSITFSILGLPNDHTENANAHLIGTSVHPSLLLDRAHVFPLNSDVRLTISLWTIFQTTCLKYASPPYKSG
jgi:hypothetical protein